MKAKRRLTEKEAAKQRGAEDDARRYAARMAALAEQDAAAESPLAKFKRVWTRP